MKDNNMEEYNQNNVTDIKSSENQKKLNNKNDSKNFSNKKENVDNKEREIKIGNYLIKKTLGKGTFGKVKLGIFLPKNKKVAVKILEKRRLKEEDDIVRLKREIEMLSQFNHPNVIAVSEIFESNDAYFTVMEYCEGGELFNYIVEHRRLSEGKSAFFYCQLINGLEYIHSLGIVHRDLKPENLLLTDEHILKIIDFGLSNYFKEDKHELLETPCGSPCYASPEMLSGENYDGFKIDIWATGIILFAMLCGFLPFDHKDNDKLFMKILECKIQYPKNLSNDAKDLIQKILVPDPKKRITIPEIKKHPFYLKGKAIFDNNFTIYQVSMDENSEDEDSSSFIYDTLENNLVFYEFNHKSETLLNKLKLFNINSLRKLRYNSYRLKRFDSNQDFKKLLNLEKEVKKLKKSLKKNKKDSKDTKLKNDGINNIDINNKINNKNSLNYNHSVILQKKDIYNLCENLINQYKKEEKNKIIPKLEFNKLMNNLNNYNNNKPHKLKQKYKTNKIILNKDLYNEIKNDNMQKLKYSKTKRINKEKELNKEMKNINLNIKKEKIIDINQNKNANIPQNKKLTNKNNINNQYKNNNIKVNIKNRYPIKINKLFINNNIIKLNKLPQNIKLKKYNKKTKTTSSKISNFKNLLDIIKQQSIKPNINIINKQNIIHHHTTNITNMTQRNYFSNVIINNYRGRDNQKNYSTSRERDKSPLDISLIQNEKERNLINEYLQKNNFQNLNPQKKNNIWKFKNNLQKMIIQDDIIFKNINRKNTQNKNSIECTNIYSTDDIRFQNFLTKRDKKIDIQKIETNISKSIPSTNNNLRNRFKTKISNIKSYNINNNLIYNNKVNIHNINENSLKSFKDSLLSNNNNIDYINNSIRERENRYINSFIYSNKTMNVNNSEELKLFNNQNILYRKKKIDKLLTNNINLNINLEQKLKNKFNTSSIENNYNNRSHNYNTLNINKINKYANLVYNINNSIVTEYSSSKKYENAKKINLEKKKLNLKKHPKLNLKELFGLDNLNKKEQISVSTNYQKQIQSQRNKLPIANTEKNIEIPNNINTVRNKEAKINISYNTGNGNKIVTSYLNNNIISKLSRMNTNQNNMRNKDIITTNMNLNFNRIHKKNKNNIINMTSDNITIKSNLIKKKTNFYNNKTINAINTSNLNKTNHNIIQNNNNINKKRMNTNIYIDKYLESKKLFSSLRKRINFKSNLINSSNIVEKNNQTKNHNNSINNKEIEKNIKNKKNIIDNFNNTKQFNITIDNTSSFNYNNYSNLKKDHKKIKSLKDTAINQKNKITQTRIHNFIIINEDNMKKNCIHLNDDNNLNDIRIYMCNTDGNTIDNNQNSNILENGFTFYNSYRQPQQYKNLNPNNYKTNKIIKEMKTNKNLKNKMKNFLYK